MSLITTRILHWIGAPIAVGTGLISTWLFTNVPGLHVFGAQASVAKALAAAGVFAVTAGLTWLSHNKFVEGLIADIKRQAGSVTRETKTTPVKTAKATTTHRTEANG